MVDEVIVQALSDGERPEKLALEPWLYRLAMQAMDEMSVRNNDLDSPVHLEDSRRRQNVEASDEAALQFHQPDEGWTKESSIADRRVTTPEQAAYSDEMVAVVQAALRGVDRTDREAFLLYGIEGFSPVNRCRAAAIICSAGGYVLLIGWVPRHVPRTGRVSAAFRWGRMTPGMVAPGARSGRPDSSANAYQ